MVTASHGDRGQLLLVAAIVVATTVLGAVVLLNTVHSSPDLSAQTDAQSVTNTERTIPQIEHDLRGLFMASSLENGTRLPYVDRSGSFDAAVDAYSGEYTRLISTDQSAVVAVEHNASESIDGAVAYANQSSADFVDSGNEFVVTDAEELPRLRIRLDDVTDDLRVRINSSDPLGTTGDDIEFEVSDSGGLTGDIQCSGADDAPVEIDLVHGAGEVTSDDAYCTVAVDESDWNLDEYNVKFEYGTDTNGTYAVSGEEGGPDPIDCVDPCETGIVNPVFDLTYQDPNAAYSSTFTLYARDV
ncbi:DUF7261 family protein [Halobacteriaceae archaeon SHR40]|uniref:DUF7261 family protein n=1 Tax=Halovenus amylolytica TaxID=2500550 RepID=UPI000FE406FA